MATDQQPGAPPGAPPGAGPDWLSGLLGSLGMPLPAQLIATLQQLNHNLEMLQDAELLSELQRLNRNLESMGPGLTGLTEALNTFLQRMWGQKAD